MHVKVHPHKSKVNAGVEKCVSITPKDGYAYYKGAARLTNAKFVIHNSGLKRARVEQVRNVHAWCVGDLSWENDSQTPPSDSDLIQVTYHYNVGRFIAYDGTDVTDGEFDTTYLCGRDFFIEKNW